MWIYLLRCIHGIFRVNSGHRHPSHDQSTHQGLVNRGFKCDVCHWKWQSFAPGDRWTIAGDLLHTVSSVRFPLMITICWSRPSEYVDVWSSMIDRPIATQYNTVISVLGCAIGSTWFKHPLMERGSRRLQDLVAKPSRLFLLGMG